MNKRYLSIDILRGLTVMLMIIVNNPGNWNHKYGVLSHAGWTGATLTDMVFPFFLFCVGLSMAFSFAKYEGRTGLALRKATKRSVLLFLCGLLLNMFPFYPTDWIKSLGFWGNYGPWLEEVRIFGVLQFIAMSYLIASIIVLLIRKSNWLIFTIALLTVAQTVLYFVFGDAGCQFDKVGNLAAKVDVFVLGESHVYGGYGLPFEPEGFIQLMSAIGNVIIGYLVGRLVRNSSEKFIDSCNTDVEASPYAVVGKTAVYGLLCLCAAEVLSIVVPISKPLWTTSYMLLGSGWALLTFALLVFIVDIKNVSWPFAPAHVFGCNALIIFLLSGVVARCIYIYAPWSPAYFCQTEILSLAYAVCFMLVHLAVAAILYKAKIFIKL